MKVILHKLFPYAPYLNEYIGFEDELMIGETALQATIRLRKLAEQSHRERYPHLYPNGSESVVESFAPPIQQSIGVINKEAERLEASIDNCDSQEELLLLNKDDVFKYKLSDQYMTKLASFQHQEFEP